MMSKTLQLSEPGRHVALRRAGRGAPVVLLHGVGMQSAAWGPQISELTKHYDVIAVDLPGHGGSAPLPKDSLLPAYVDWCSEVLRSLNTGPVSLVGHSMGALIATGMATQHPDLVSRVALLNGVYRRNAAARNAVINRAQQIRAGHVDHDTPLQRWFDSTPTDQAARRDVAGWLAQVDPAGYATAYWAFAHGDAVYADQIPQIACPFLALTGDQDPNSTPQMAQAMAEAAQDGTAKIIKGHRHMAGLTDPDAVNAALKNWLTQPVKSPEPL